MLYPVLNAIYDAIYDAWLTYINYMHVLDADSDYEIENDTQGLIQKPQKEIFTLLWLLKKKLRDV